MSALLGLLALCLLLGVLARRSGRFPAHVPAGLNVFILDIALPALVLRVVRTLRLEPALLAAALAPWLVFVGALVLARLARGADARTRGALVLTAGLGNTAFVGLPLVEALLGREGLAVAVVADQIGSFLALAVGGSWVAARASGPGQALGARALVRKVVLFPPFLALVAALLLRPVALPAWVDTVLGRLGDTLTPLALFSVGFNLRLAGLRARAGALLLGLGYKLALAPLLVWLVLRVLPGGTSPLVLHVAVLQAAMAPMVSGAILAVEHELDPPLANLMVGLGIPLSLLTVPALHMLLGA